MGILIRWFGEAFASIRGGVPRRVATHGGPAPRVSGARRARTRGEQLRGTSVSSLRTSTTPILEVSLSPENQFFVASGRPFACSTRVGFATTAAKLRFRLPGGSLLHDLSQHKKTDHLHVLSIPPFPRRKRSASNPGTRDRCSAVRSRRSRDGPI